MNTKESCQIGPSISIAVGILLPLSVYSLALFWVIIGLGEFHNLAATARSGIFLACLSTIVYGMAEFILYPKTSIKSLFAISYFLSFSILTALFYIFTASSPLFGAFLGEEESARALLRLIGSRLCAFQALALLIRIGVEIVRYLTSFRRR